MVYINLSVAIENTAKIRLIYQIVAMCMIVVSDVSINQLSRNKWIDWNDYKLMYVLWVT